ncbi:MAG: tRNA preQ1(34) S-adenosylmethionine ribosyltransferase-isomerase QueA [Dehalococcoidia bacterium]|nr:tRNA preQ1(34) S-adenosylmethionine ribosyltransferase-isomerase QueA [Dehalococcoidia bacterium]
MPTPDDRSLDSYNYDLPQELIAQTPIEPRDSSRLMVVDRAERRFEHRVFTDLLEYLRPGDVIVFNDSRVFPARMYGVRTDTGAKIELLLLQRRSPGVWHTLARPGRRMPPGTTFELRGGTVAVQGEVLEAHDDGSRTVRLSDEDRLDEIGVVPLPPYIQEPLEDPERYQTVYARERGSVAAPTAGLHVTPRLLEKIRRHGVETAFVTLHVGWATFRPVQVEEITDHEMHAEFYTLSDESTETINRAKREGRRVIAVGTTTVRLLEYAATLGGEGGTDTLTSGSGWADIFIYPGYEFRVIDALVTNFHLPQSTLLMLVSAFADRDLMLAAYREAVNERYRFYSFGDAMLIL